MLYHEILTSLENELKQPFTTDETGSKPVLTVSKPSQKLSKQKHCKSTNTHFELAIVQSMVILLQNVHLARPV